MSNNFPLIPPPKKVARTSVINIRVSPQEKRDVDAIAAHLGIAAAQFARHYVLQAAAHFLNQAQHEDSQHGGG